MATKLEPQWTADTAAGSATGPFLALRGWRVTNEHINGGKFVGTDVSASEVYPKQVPQSHSVDDHRTTYLWS